MRDGVKQREKRGGLREKRGGGEKEGFESFDNFVSNVFQLFLFLFFV